MKRDMDFVRDILLRVEHVEYLDDIRDPDIWRQTKEGANQVGGFSLDVLRALAKGLVKKNIEKHTGVEIDL